MQRIGFAAVLAVALAASGSAFAGTSSGNQGCELVRTTATDNLKNPGTMLQYLRTDQTLPPTPGVKTYSDVNPKDVVNLFPRSFSNVGDLIAQKCRGTTLPD